MHWPPGFQRFRQPNEVIAGIHKCSGERCVVIDVDLHDPPQFIYDLYQKLCEEYDVVYAKQRSR
jgi:polyisoprenyl-phosphate glycosyltransferase